MKKIIFISVMLLCGLLYECRFALAKDVKLTLTATASSVYGTSTSYKASNAVDGLLSTFWLSGYNSSPWWIMFSMDKESDIASINPVWLSAAYMPTDFDIQVSLDGQKWENVYTGISGMASQAGYAYNVKRRARYLRLFIRAAKSNPAIRECEVYGTINLPNTIRFQGTLKDTGKAPLEGTYALTFRMYNRETGGTTIWEEVQADKEIAGGLLDVELGSVTPLDIPFDEQYWLGVEVDADGEMEPRFKLSAVPFAIRSSE